MDWSAWVGGMRENRLLHLVPGLGRAVGAEASRGVGQPHAPRAGLEGVAAGLAPTDPKEALRFCQNCEKTPTQGRHT